MKIENIYYAIAKEDLYFNDTVVIEGDKCRKADWHDFQTRKLYSVIKNTKKGTKTALSGPDTKFYVEIEPNEPTPRQEDPR